MKDIASLIKEADAVLDIGSYDCELLNYVRPNKYSAVDLTPKKEGIIRLNVSYESLPFPDCTFDKVIMSMLLSHIDNPLFALNEARRVLKDEGKLILIFTNIENVNKLLQGLFLRDKFLQKPNLSYISVFGTQEIANILARAGFGIDKFEKKCAELFGYCLPFLDWTKLFSEYVLVVAKKGKTLSSGWEYGKKGVFLNELEESSSKSNG